MFYKCCISVVEVFYKCVIGDYKCVISNYKCFISVLCVL